MAYQPIVVTVDPAAITQDKIDALQARIPGLEVRVGHPIYFLLEVTSDRDAENLQLLSDRADGVWDSYGAQILRLPRGPATQATGLSTWTRVNTPDAPLSAPLTVPAGTPLTLAGDGVRIAFETRAAVTFAAAATSTLAGEVEIIATDPGENGNGLQGDPQTEQTFTWLNTITVLAPTAGGAEEEDLTAYRDRIADEASIMARTLVQAANFAVAARDVAGVDRALAIDNYNPGPPISSSAGGHVTVAVIDAAGLDPGSTVRGNVLAELVSRALTNLTVHVIAPAYTTITVVFTGKSKAGYDPADVEVRAEQAVLDFLSPARWGLPSIGDQRLWIDTPLVRYQDVVAVLGTVEGFDYYTALTVNGGTADVTLIGPAGLPGTASTAAGTVTA